jgi:hypothetical protein
MQSCENQDNCQESSCTTCHDYATLKEDGTCECARDYEMEEDGHCYVVLNKCGAGFFVDERSGDCVRCNGPCVNCNSADEGDCYGECKDFALFEPFTNDWSRGQCYCEPGFGLDQETMTCKECTENCYYCDMFDYTICHECSLPFIPKVDDNGDEISPLECECPYNNNPCQRPQESGICDNGIDENGEECECHSSCYSCKGTGPYDCVDCATARSKETMSTGAEVC